VFTVVAVYDRLRAKKRLLKKMMDIFKIKTPELDDLEKYRDQPVSSTVSDLAGETGKPFYKNKIFLAIMIISVSLSVISMIISLFIR